MTKDQLKKFIVELDQEMKNLRDYADNLDSENDNQAIEIEELKKENRKLKDKIKRLEFDVDAWHQLKLLLEGEIGRLREELSAYDREYFDEDKKAKNIFIDKSGKVIKGGEFTTLC